MSNKRVGYMRLSLDDEYGVESLTVELSTLLLIRRSENILIKTMA